MLTNLTNIYGFKPVDKKYKEMEKIYHLCISQGIKIPEEVGNFFNGEYPDPCGVIIDIKNKSYVKEYQEEMQEGFEIVIDQIPKGLKIIRFVNSW